MFLGIRRDGTTKIDAQVQPSGQYIYPGYYNDTTMNDIGECVNNNS